MTECNHEAPPEARPTTSNQMFPHRQDDYATCIRCGALLQLARRSGIWYNPESPHDPGPPWKYTG